MYDFEKQLKTSEQLGTALQIAIEAHTDQVDRGGAPYILHPLWVMSKMETDEERMVALMHDVLEDCPTLMINWEYFPTEVEEAVMLLTKSRQGSYWHYIGKISENPLARKVKMADLDHNMDMSRLNSPTTSIREEDIARWEKYKKAYDFLESCGGESD